LTGADDGGIPNGGLTNHDGALYGTTQPGSNRLHCRLYGRGTVFKPVLNAREVGCSAAHRPPAPKQM
jgi:hypothetical protein